jgi:hypothetical protein
MEPRAEFRQRTEPQGNLFDLMQSPWLANILIPSRQLQRLASIRQNLRGLDPAAKF